MKKILFILGTIVLLTTANATSATSNSKNAKPMHYSRSLHIEAYDRCGQKLSFNISCGSCSYGALGAGADAFIHDHTDSHGCFH
ncbi:MAG: hypothetical protein EAZ35_05450 [Sphingobacteriia bacterium]|nr:MAG: hypothetical protein EAZ41_07980 [Sphingobacteriia bacterium]TAG30983.1 MAG: hypothetical protein EAZ35_05450 [Sphingobacteriia bacterium]